MSRRPPCELPAVLSSFFNEHLLRIRGASAHTLRGYSASLRLFLSFVANARGVEIDGLHVADLDAEAVGSFLLYLEETRGNSPDTRNCRLAALRAFYRHLMRSDPANSQQYSRVLALPSKKTRVKPASYLEPDQVRTIIAQPDRRSLAGRRDYALLLFLYNTGARVAEAIPLTEDRVTFDRPARARLLGKGKRERLCPLWSETAVALRRLLDGQPRIPGAPLFRNQRGERLSRDGVAYILKKHAERAAERNRSLRGRSITPHVLRHSCAVALLQSGVDLTVIRDYLGHASVATTNRYVATNLKMREKVLQTFWERTGLDSTSDSSWEPDSATLRFLRSLS